ncbi:MAG: ATP-binding protein [Burkholderiaceae bacterium]|nr:ATP-binding protein [Burkholderiaceae bacterium]
MLDELFNAVKTELETSVDRDANWNFEMQWRSEFGGLTNEEKEIKVKAWHHRWERLKHRLAEELRRGVSLHSIAKDTGLDVVHLDAWTKNFSHFRFGQRIGENTLAEVIESTLEAKFNQLDIDRSKEAQSVPATIETSVTRDVVKAIKRARNHCFLIDFSATSGSGKTTGIEAYLEEVRKTEGFDCPVWRITMKPAYATSKGLLQLIALAMGASSNDSRSESQSFDYIERFSEGKHGVLIIDEAQQMLDVKKDSVMPMINNLRSFIDAGLFGVVLLGNDEIYQELRRKKAQQILGRMTPYRVVSKGVTEDDIRKVIDAYHVKGKKETEMCLRIAKKEGLHQMVGFLKASIAQYKYIDELSLEAVSKGYI